MKNEITKLRKTQEQHQHAVEEQFKQTAIREQQNFKTMEATMKQTVDHVVQQSFALQTQRMDEKFAELKHLFVSQKRPAPESGSAMES